MLLCLAALVSSVYLFSRGGKPVTPGNARTSPSSQAPGGEVAPPFGPSHGEDTDDYTPYDRDPRVNAGGAEDGVPHHDAGGALDYVELQCEGGKPDVDLSYWKDISQDK